MSNTYCDGVKEVGYTLEFKDGRLATQVTNIPPGEKRWVLIISGGTKDGVGVVSSLSAFEDDEVLSVGSRVVFSGGTDEKPPCFSALLG